MAGIGEAVAGQVAGEVATSLLANIKKNIGYIYHYHDNLNALQEADGQLVAKMSDERKFSGETSRGLREVGAVVENWRSNSEEVHQKADKLISRNYISRLNPLSRYSTSRHASKLTPIIREKVQSAPDFGISFDSPIREGAKFNLGGYMEFDSRLKIQIAVLDALRNDNVSMCSICGIGGMGKTMMAKKIVQIVEADHLFDKVAMVTVSQNPNLEEIQKGIIESLELKIDDNVSMQGRAKKLNDWLLNNKSLLVLDDVWWQLHAENFEAIGIPLGTNVCKIFITSRNLDECRKMGSEPNIPLKDLDDGEAWDLFMQNAGQCIEEGNLQDTARKIVVECKGLPIAIATIATTLKGNPLGAWNDSLTKLRKSNLPGIPDMEKVYSKIQVSYDLLNNPEAQSCLLLCCLFPEDDDIPIEKLVFYGWGLEIFDGVDSLKEARDRVDSIIHKLKSSFLLLDGRIRGYVKLHDIVRDFAIWISSKHENPYLVRCEKEMGQWPENCQYEKCHAISFVCQKLKNPPIGLRCPNLRLLQLHFENGSDELPNDFFDGMEEVRVVDVDVPSKLPPLTKQKALRTLLISNNSDQTVPLGYMKNLEIFSLSWMSSLSEFPVEIGMMCNLRCLKFAEVSFTYMPPGVLSKLVQLEELELPPAFNDWGIQKEGRTNASLDEIAFLPLTSITIGLRKGSILAENIVKRITRFRVFIERYSAPYFTHFDSNVLDVNKVDACDALVKWTSSLLRKCNELQLGNMDLKYIMSQRLGGNNGYQTECFSQLKTFWIEGMNFLEEILHGTYLSNTCPCFTNLNSIDIENCPKLKRAFPLSVAREFTQLESMVLRDCREMEAVFYDDQEDSGNQAESGVKLNATSKGKQPKHIPNDQVASSVRLNNLRVAKSSISCPTPTSFVQCLLPKGKQPKHLPSHQIIEENVGKSDEREADHVIVWPQLKKLLLRQMPKLRVMYDGDHAIECPSLEELTVSNCYKMEGLSYGSFSAPKIKKLDLHKMTNVPKWLHFEQDSGILLKELRIVNFNEMIYLVDAMTDRNPLKTLFCNSEDLLIWNMGSLEEIWHGPYLSQPCFTHLTNITINYCPKLKHVFPLSVATELTDQLQQLEIQNCKKMEEIFYKDQVADGNQNASSVELKSPTIVTESTPSCSFIPTHQIMEENVGKVDETEADWVIKWPRLKRLKLSGMPKLRVMYNGNHAIECPSLEELIIGDCNKMEGLSYGSFSAPKIKKLELQDMKNIPKWLNLEQDSGILLKELRIGNCNEMIYLVDAMTDQNPLKTLFCNSEDLWIWNMGSLEEIWHGPYLSQPCFTHLTNITIEDCPKLKHVFPLSVATKMTQLQKLYIRRCKEIDEIFYKDQVADGNQNASSVDLNSPTIVTESTPPYSFTPSHQRTEENIQKVDPAIVFPQLKVLSLEHMPELRVMYNGNHTIECPLLEELTISDCNNMEGLSYGSFSAPKIKKLDLHKMTIVPKWLHFEQDSGILLKELWIRNCNEMTNGNLLITLFCNLDVLWITSMDSLEEIWPQNMCFTHLTWITVSHCPKLKHVFPLSVATELTRLQVLYIGQCEEMEEIFYKDQVADGNQNASSVELNSATSVTESTPPYSFIPSHQKTVKKNTRKKEVDDAVIAATIFPQLEKLLLEDLTKLRIFYDGNHAIKLPSLKKVRITRCDKMEALSNGSFKAPKLVKVSINATTKYSSVSEDLNTVVRKS